MLLKIFFSEHLEHLPTTTLQNFITESKSYDNFCSINKSHFAISISKNEAANEIRVSVVPFLSLFQWQSYVVVLCTTKKEEEKKKKGQLVGLMG